MTNASCLECVHPERQLRCVQADALAGLTVGIMTVPQALSYARIAGLPSEYGLYGAFTPVLAYAVFGSSRQLVRWLWCSLRQLPGLWHNWRLPGTCLTASRDKPAISLYRNTLADSQGCAQS
jgi:hypothetical protein